MYVYEEYETSWWRRFNTEEYLAEQKIRREKGLSWFKLFRTDEDQGDNVHLSSEKIAEIRDLVILRCHSCGHCWSYRGFAFRETSCPKCQGQVSLSADKIYVDLPPMGTFHGPLPAWALKRGHPLDDHGYYMRDDGALILRCPDEPADGNPIWVHKCPHEESHPSS